MADQQMSEHWRQLLAGARETLRPLLPQRFRIGTPVVPVVRFSGVIGLSTPLRPGVTLAGMARFGPPLAALTHAAGIGEAPSANHAGEVYAPSLHDAGS